jgi:hypothetical protein
MQPLWERALANREAEKMAVRSAVFKAAGRRGGWKKREYPEPKPGDLFGNVRVVRCTGRGRQGRADLSFEVECLTCGARVETFEYNLRGKTRTCALPGKRAHGPPRYKGSGVNARVPQPEAEQ